MRLIDADAFLKTENERCNGEPIIGTCTGNNEYLRHRIESQPIAYDVDKVVEQLKKSYSCDMGTLKMVTLETAIDIVKRGGTDEK